MNIISIMTLSLIIIIISSIASLISVRWAYFKILHIAKEKNIVDNPDARKLQDRPVPILGGITIFFGLLMGVLIGLMTLNIADIYCDYRFIAIVIAMVVMLYIGAMDDIIGLSPLSRFVFEILVVLGLIFVSGRCIDSLHGIWGINSFTWYIAVPFTVFASVGIINAFNMIDGVNGLSSGLCIVCSFIFGLVFIKVNDIANAILAFSMTASLIPFMIHNVFGDHSRMFIGDAGTMVMGVGISWFVMSLLWSGDANFVIINSPNSCLVAFSLAVLSVPVFDTIRVMMQRIANKKSPFHPDKTHLHHAFIKVGISHFITSLTEIVIDLLVVAIWALSVINHATPDVQLYVVVGSSMVLVWGTYTLFFYHAKRHTDFLHRLTGFSVRTHLGRTNWWRMFTSWLDAPEKKYLEHTHRNKRVLNSASRFDHIDPNNFKEQDRKKIYDFMKGRAEVYVQDIKENSGAESMRVYPILFEEEMDGYVVVIKRTALGTPVIVACVE